MRRGALCCDRTASRQPQPSVGGPLHLLPRASEAATANVSDIGHGAFAGASAHVSDHPQRSNRYADPVGGSVVGGDPTERDPTSGDLPERDLTTKPCVSIVTAQERLLLNGRRGPTRPSILWLGRAALHAVKQCRLWVLGWRDADASLCSGLLAAMPRCLCLRLERNSAGRCDCCAPECRRHRLSRGMW